MNKTYQWYWKNEEGHPCGWNWTNASSKKEARKIAKEMESPARDSKYGRFAGMYLDKDSLRRVTNKEFMNTWNATSMS